MITAFKLCYCLVILSLTPNCVITSNQTASSNWTICEARDSLVCECKTGLFTDVIARCHFSHVADLRLIIDVPQNVVQMNLSGNSIQEIPRHSFQNYTQLVYLSLSSNNIHTISQGAFSGLTRLRELNLQDNIIIQWDATSIQQDLPNLSLLNIAGNIYWKPDEQILSLPELKILVLLEFKVRHHLTYFYFRCYLHKSNSVIKDRNYTFVERFPKNATKRVDPNSLLIAVDSCHYYKLVFKDASYWDVIYESGFHFHCVETKEYIHSHIQNEKMQNSREHGKHKLKKWYYTKEKVKQHCWKLIKKIHIFTLIEGICAMFLNLIVIITTGRSRVLRESVAHVLVANIAVGDLFFSLYLIIITTTRQSMDGNEFYDFHLPYYCRIVGLLLLIGQCSTPLTSFIMTLERYLAVVYCMRPHIRITRTMCNVAMVTIWSLSVSIAVSFMTSPHISKKTDRMCVPENNVNDKPVFQYGLSILILIYILSIILYLHVYVDFKKTNQKTVQLQRENRLARRIAFIIFTNVFFVILPLVIIFIILYFFKDYISGVDSTILWETLTLTCVGFNSCLNPFVFSFRNEKFRNEFRKNRIVCRGSVAVHS